MDWLIRFASSWLNPTGMVGKVIIRAVRQGMVVFGAWLVGHKIADGTAVASLTDAIISLVGAALPVLVQFMSHWHTTVITANAVQAERDNPTPTPLQPTAAVPPPATPGTGE